MIGLVGLCMSETTEKYWPLERDRMDHLDMDNRVRILGSIRTQDSESRSLGFSWDRTAKSAGTRETQLCLFI